MSILRQHPPARRNRRGTSGQRQGQGRQHVPSFTNPKLLFLYGLVFQSTQILDLCWQPNLAQQPEMRQEFLQKVFALRHFLLQIEEV
jgi:hypothetical protein